MEDLEPAPRADMEELEQRWRAEAEAKRPEFVARILGEIGNDADYVDIESIVSGDVENYIINRRILFQQTASRAEELQKARNKAAAAKAQHRFDQRKRIREVDLPLLSRKDTEAFHTIKAAKAASATSDRLCEEVSSQFQTMTEDLKWLGEAPDAIPSAKDLIPNIFAEREAQQALQQSRFIDSLKADKDALKDELDAANKKINDLEASHKTSCDDEHDAYAGLDQLATESNRTLADAERDLLTVHKQYYKHISTLTHKCSKCQHASKKSQRDMCYNQACQDAGDNKVKAKEDTSLYFDHNVLARQAKMGCLDKDKKRPTRESYARIDFFNIHAPPGVGGSGSGSGSGGGSGGGGSGGGFGGGSGGSGDGRRHRAGSRGAGSSLGR